MTLETCRTRLRIAQARGNAEEVQFWEARIANRMRLPRYAQGKPTKSKKET